MGAPGMDSSRPPDVVVCLATGSGTLRLTPAVARYTVASLRDSVYKVDLIGRPAIRWVVSRNLGEDSDRGSCSRVESSYGYGGGLITGPPTL